MRKRTKRMLSFLMAALMVVGIMPVYLFTGKTTEVSAEERMTATEYSNSLLGMIDLTKGVQKDTQVGDTTLNVSFAGDVSYNASADSLTVGDRVFNGYLNPTTNANESNGLPTKGEYLKLAPTEEGDVSLYIKINKNKDFKFIKDDGTIVDTVSNKTDAGINTVKTYSLDAGTVYYAYVKDSKMPVYGIKWESAKKITNYTFSPEPADASQKAENTVYIGKGATIDENIADSGLVAKGKSDYKAEKAEIEGVSYTNMIKGFKVNAAAGTVPTNDYLEFTAEQDGYLKLAYKLDKGGKKLYVVTVGSDGQVYYDVVTNTDVSNSLRQATEYPVIKGNKYYVYAQNGNLTLYGFSVTKGLRNTVIPWENIPTPVIDSVVANDDEGTIDVTFSKADIDQYTGADYLMLSMVDSEGNEAAHYQIDSKGTKSIAVTPYWSDKFTFTLTAIREGYAFKTSEAKTIDYVLPLTKPYFNLLANEGEGKVYLDWYNVENAKFTLSYKEESAADYVTVFSDKENVGDYTFTDLEAGKTYSIKVSAVSQDADGNEIKSFYEDKITVSNTEDQQWYSGVIGSQQTDTMVVTDKDGNSKSVTFDAKDTTVASKRINNVESADITVADSSEKSGTVSFSAEDSGKIANDNDGMAYYYTKINPNTENFKLSATFEITDTSKAVDGQTGFGILASDIIGQNPNMNNITIKHKHFNSIGSMYDGKSKALVDYSTMRISSGLTSPDASYDKVSANVTFQNMKGVVTKPEVGNKYTYTLEKTNDKYIATVSDGTNTASSEYSDLSVLSQQEDGSIIVGLFCARKIGVVASDVVFTKTASTGVGSTEVKPAETEKVKPDARIYSTKETGNTDYELIVAANVAGKLKVTAPDGKSSVVAVEADSVARVNVALSLGTNKINTEFTPAAGQNLTSEDAIVKSIEVNVKQYGYAGHTIYAAPDGTAAGDGSEKNPLDINTAVKYAQPGQTIVMKDGSYTSGISIPRSSSGTADKMITIRPETKDGVSLNNSGIRLEGSYWHIYNINVYDAPANGILIAGNYNVVEMCNIERAVNTGLQISRSGSATNAQGIKGLLWPSYNLVKNCTASSSDDALHNDADGFAAKLTCGNGNKFYGCIAFNNIDDGWDLYAKPESGEIGSVTIENCVAYENGIVYNQDGTVKATGEGNGFKLGGGDLFGDHVLKNCISFNNRAKGITSNSNPGSTIINCTSYGNATESASYSVGLNAMVSKKKLWKISGLISITGAKNTKLVDEVPFNQVIGDSSNYIYTGSGSQNKDGVIVDEKSWFVNTDVKNTPTRNENGTINMHELLTLTAAVSENTGARLDTTSEAAISVMPELGTTDHVYGEWTTTKEATCTEKGEQHRTCTICGVEETRETEALGHEFSSEFTVDKEATTVEEGSKSQHCLHEGCTEKTNVTAIPKTEAPKKVNVKTETTGDMKDYVKVDGINNTDEILEFTESEVEAINSGDVVKVEVKVEDISKTVSEQDSAKIADTLKKNEKVKDYVVGSYISIDVIKRVGDKDSKLTTTTKELQFEITLNDNLINNDSSKKRTYKVLRIHDGDVDILDAAYDKTTNKLTFKTDKFSTYAIIYIDSAVEVKPDDKPVVDEPTQPATKDETPAATEPANIEEPATQTGDSMHAVPYVLAMVISAGLVVLVASRKKKCVR